MAGVIIPFIVLFVILYGFLKKVDLYDNFLVGVKEGLSMALKIFPTIFAMTVCINIMLKSNIINDVVNLHFYKVFLPGAIGTGQFGETISTPVVGFPNDGSTESFLSIGSLRNRQEAENVTKYIKTKKNSL